MKEFHPSGVAIDNLGNITHYFLSKVPSNSIRAKTVIGPSVILTSDTFKNYVEENRVQLFQIVNGMPKVCYTDEEIDYFKNKIKDYTLLDNEEYFKSEAVFKNSAFIYNSDKFWLSFAFVCCRHMRLTRTYIVQGAIHLHDYLEGPEVDMFQKMVKSGCVFLSPTTTNMCLCNWELGRLQKFLEESSKYYNISICTKTMLNTNNTIYSRKMIGFPLPALSEVNYVSELLDKYNTDSYMDLSNSSNISFMSLS